MFIDAWQLTASVHATFVNSEYKVMQMAGKACPLIVWFLGAYHEYTYELQR